MIKKILQFFNIYGEEHVNAEVIKAEEKTKEECRKYYQNVLDIAMRIGSLPPDTDLKMPKQSVVIKNKKDEVLAEKGRWLRLPSNGEKVIISYSKD